MRRACRVLSEHPPFDLSHVRVVWEVGLGRPTDGVDHSEQANHGIEQILSDLLAPNPVSI